MERPKRVAVIGIDGGMAHLIEKHIADGHLPTFKALIEGGALAEHCLGQFPTITPPNWTTLATGASAGTHQITDFWLPVPGKTPENANTVQAFSSERCQAEFIWDVLDKAGKRCVVLNYPGSWPSHMRHGVMVGGAGLAANERRDGLPGLNSTFSLCANQCITTGFYPEAIRGTFVEAEDWLHLEEPGDEPLEMAASLNFPQAPEQPAPTTWYVLARDSRGEGYDTVTLSPTRDASDAFCTLKAGEWSPKITTTIAMADGSRREVFFRCKLLEISPDADAFRLFLTSLVDIAPWCSPPEAAARVTSAEGVPIPRAGLVEYSLGIFDLETFLECIEIYIQWLADAAVGLLKDRDWDLFYVHSHPADWLYHAVLMDLDPITNADEASQTRAWQALLRMYAAQDRLTKAIMDCGGEGTLVALVSDHGEVAEGLSANLYEVLGPNLVTLHEEATKTGAGKQGELERGLGMGVKVDPSRSKAFPQRSCYIQINLKGRDPEGIVAPEDYGKVQQEIIDALYAYRHPQTGERMVALALTKHDARLLGLHGDNCGDVVYALKPDFGNTGHGNLLATAVRGMGAVKELMVLSGPGIAAGQRLQRTVHNADMVPTICYLMDWPVPATVDGAVVYQFYADPNYKTS
ncbi:MAG: alkaline phosphatase family protein [Chloroflexota bacterium]